MKMLMLSQSEAYRQSYIAQLGRNNPGFQKLGQGIGLIRPDNIALEIEKLKLKKKTSAQPLLMEALSLYTAPIPRIMLFDVGPDMPLAMPAVIYSAPVAGGQAAQAQMIGTKYETNGANNGLCVFLNMYTIGKWDEDGTHYMGLESLADLCACLETGVIMYHMVVAGDAETIIQSTDVMSNLVRVYSDLFFTSFIGACRSSFSKDTYNVDVVYHIAAKFLMIHCLGMEDSDELDRKAWEYSVRNDTSFDAIKMTEDGMKDINYQSLSSVIEQTSSSLFRTQASIVDFIGAWMKVCGDGSVMACEYVPFLLHYLFAAIHNARLGNANRLTTRINDLKKDGIDDLYAAVVRQIR